MIQSAAACSQPHGSRMILSDGENVIVGDAVLGCIGGEFAVAQNVDAAGFSAEP